MNAKTAGQLRALRNATPRANAAPAPAPSGAKGSSAPPLVDAPIEIVSGDTPTKDHGESHPPFLEMCRGSHSTKSIKSSKRNKSRSERRLAKEAVARAEEEEHLKLIKEITAWWKEAREELRTSNHNQIKQT
ncbi:UNVERIFIED_CONTAM: hypothetical protein Slati_2152700 [Sesamum latifolium]|uniref:Uncharacterized protein n=1 Tax=Sesamum latifolium TaxID=2727402 RepID=A0AAW2WW21_9LAMI